MLIAWRPSQKWKNVIIGRKRKDAPSGDGDGGGDGGDGNGGEDANDGDDERDSDPDGRGPITPTIIPLTAAQVRRVDWSMRKTEPLSNTVPTTLFSSRAL